jgi:hypothetical protein
MAEGGVAFCGAESSNRLVRDEKNGSIALHTSFAESFGWMSKEVKESLRVETLIKGLQ